MDRGAQRFARVRAPKLGNRQIPWGPQGRPLHALYDRRETLLAGRAWARTRFFLVSSCTGILVRLLIHDQVEEPRVRRRVPVQCGRQRQSEFGCIHVAQTGMLLLLIWRHGRGANRVRRSRGSSLCSGI